MTEKKLGLEASQKDRDELKEGLMKAAGVEGVSVVEREG